MKETKISARAELAKQIAAAPIELQQKLDLHMRLLPPIFSSDDTWKNSFTSLIFAAEMGRDLNSPAKSVSLTKYTGKEATTLRDIVLFFHLEHYTNGKIIRTPEEEFIKI